jgi:hypothetical protein
MQFGDVPNAVSDSDLHPQCQEPRGWFRLRLAGAEFNEKGQPPKQSHVTESRRLLKRLPWKLIARYDISRVGPNPTDCRHY